MGEKVFVKGCVAVAEAALRAGCRFFAGYPITPQNDIPEYMAANLPKVGGVFVQGESEVASVNMVYGASATGFRAMTSSSSCGMSLKSEGISYLAGANLPAVISEGFPISFILQNPLEMFRIRMKRLPNKRMNRRFPMRQSNPK